MLRARIIDILMNYAKYRLVHKKKTELCDEERKQTHAVFICVYFFFFLFIQPKYLEEINLVYRKLMITNKLCSIESDIVELCIIELFYN